MRGYNFYLIMLYTALITTIQSSSNSRQFQKHFGNDTLKNERQVRSESICGNEVLRILFEDVDRTIVLRHIHVIR